MFGISVRILAKQRLKPEVDPGRRRGIVMRRQEQLWLEQLDERPRVVDLCVGDRMHLIGDDCYIHRSKLFGERPHARGDRSGAADEDSFEA